MERKDMTQMLINCPDCDQCEERCEQEGVKLE